MKFAIVALLGVIASASEAEWESYGPPKHHRPHKSYGHRDHRSGGRHYGVHDRSHDSYRKRGGSRRGKVHPISLGGLDGLNGVPGVPGLRGVQGLGGLDGTGFNLGGLNGV